MTDFTTYAPKTSLETKHPKASTLQAIIEFAYSYPEQCNEQSNNCKLFN